MDLLEDEDPGRRIQVCHPRHHRPKAVSMFGAPQQDRLQHACRCRCRCLENIRQAGITDPGGAGAHRPISPYRDGPGALREKNTRLGLICTGPIMIIRLYFLF